MEPVVARALAFAFEVEVKGLAIGDVPAEAFTIHPREPYMTRFDRRRRAEAHRVFHRHAREYGQCLGLGIAVIHCHEDLLCNVIAHGNPPSRSEEHTSELQSLMRISYAVFCLKKKNIQNLSSY